MEDRKKNATDALLEKAKNKSGDKKNDAYNRLYINEMMNKVSKKIDEKDPAVIKAFRALMNENKNFY